MKKSIFIVTFVILSLIFSYSFVMATDNNNLVDGVKSTVNNAENMAQNAGQTVGGAIKNGAEDAGNTVKDSTQKAGNTLTNGAENAGNAVQNGMENMGYTATRTATEQNTGNTTQGWMSRDIWTWIIVGIITIVIVALIWYYASRNNQ